MLLHLGDLHAYEKALVAAIALGPFLVLFVLVALRQRNADGTQQGDEPGRADGPGKADEPGQTDSGDVAEDPSAETRTAGSGES